MIQSIWNPRTRLPDRGRLFCYRFSKSRTDTAQPTRRRRGFTLLELLIVVLILAILSAIGAVNLQILRNRALKASDAANMRTIASALQTYLMDYDDLPPADREAGPFMSHSEEFVDVGNGPAAGGSWDGIPWLLVEFGYIEDWRVLFCPRYLKQYSGGTTIRGNHARYHNFRYAYNSSALASGGHEGGDGNVMSGEVWILRDLYLGPQEGFYAAQYPGYPADFAYPWGEGDYVNQLEHVMFADMAVKTVVGGEDQPPPDL